MKTNRRSARSQSALLSLATFAAHARARAAMRRSAAKLATSVGLACLFITPSARAASAAWNFDSDGNWVDDSKWSPAAAPGAISGVSNGDVATFGFTLSTDRAITVDTGRNIGGITFANTSAFKYTLTGGSLLLSNGGLIQTAAGNGDHTDTIGTDIEIQGDGGVANFTAGATSATSLLSIGGSITGVSTASNVTALYLNGTNTGANAVTGNIGDGSLGGKLTVEKTGTGTWVLAGNNSYTGATTISGGTLSFGASNNLGDGSQTSNTIGLSGGGTLLFTGTSVDLGVNRSIALGAGGGNLSTAAGKTLTISGALSGTTALGVTGGGTVVLNADNSGFSGNVNVDSIGGTANTTLRLTNDDALTGGTVNLAQGTIAGGTGTSLDLVGVTIGNGVTLAMNSNLASNFRSALTASSGTSVWNGGVTMNGDGLNQFNTAGTLTVNGNITDGGAFTGTLFIRGSGTGTINGTINLPNGILNKTDGGTWTIASPSAPVISALQVSDGTMKIGATDTFSTSQALTLGQASATNGNFDLNGFDQTLSSIAVNVASTGTDNRISNSSGTLSTLTLNNSAAVDYRGSLQGNLKLVVDGSAPVTLRGSGSTSTGGLQINAGRNVILNLTGASTTVTGTGVTTAVVNNPVGAGAISLAAASVLDLNPLATVSQNGLSGRVFNGAPANNDSTTVNFTGTASSTRWDASLNRFDLTTASGGGTAITPTTNFAAQWLGKLNITNAGDYRFFAASDDGTRVFIDGVLVVNNDGSKGTTVLGGAATNLSAGLHDVRVEYTQGVGGAAAILSWAGTTAGLDAPLIATAIPTGALFAAESNSTAGSSNAIVIGAGSGDDLSVTASSTINLNGTAFTQAQLGGLTNTAGTTLTVNGLAGKTLRFAGNTTVTGSLTINNTPNIAIDGVLAGTGATIVKLGSGRLTFGQTTVANTIDAASLIDVQDGTAVLLGLAGGNNPIGSAGIQLSGGNLLLDSKANGATYDNAIIVTENATIQDIVAGVGPIATTLGGVTNGISIASGKTLTFDAITGGNNLANNQYGSTEGGAQITVAGAVTGAGNLNAISTSFGNHVTPGIVVLNNSGNTFGGSITVNGTTFTGNTTVPVNGPTLRVGAAGALPSGAANAIFVKSGTLDFATNTSPTRRMPPMSLLWVAARPTRRLTSTSGPAC